MAEGQYSYWAKTTKDGLPGIDVLPHCRNVGFVAALLAATKKQSLENFGFSVGEASLLAALHDIGKASPGFQSKCPAWLEQYGLSQEATNKGWLDDGRCERLHDRVSQFTAFNYLIASGMPAMSADLYSSIIGAHHGRPHRIPDSRGLPGGKQIEIWEKERLDVVRQLAACLGEPPRKEIKRDDPALWWLAGLISISDWIGSDEEYFDNSRNIGEDEGRECATSAIEKIRFGSPELKEGLGFPEIFQLGSETKPNALQQAAFESIIEPGIYAIEAPMGMGKTEAALWVAYNLIKIGKATGFYFALPTQVTSNRIHMRVSDFVENVSSQSHRVNLVHANSWLMENVYQPKPGKTSQDKKDKAAQDARAGSDWFASSKRALLAPFGVGTIDQALLASIAAKHFFVRRFALAGKVIIIDEVHSYDVYTGTLIKALCDDLEKLGCTVILLSATLTKARRLALLGIDEGTNNNAVDPYPLITGRRNDGVVISPVAADPPPFKKVYPLFKVKEEALQSVLDAAKAGACVLWICNTIGEAQNIYEYFLKNNTDELIDIGLLHSRFPYFKREEIEQEWMEKLGKNNADRNGCILVSTQVVEQSVDLDADLLVTELAPTDMLLQRMGRLWRHDRGNRSCRQPECWIIQPGSSFEEMLTAGSREIEKTLKPSSNVYHAYVLLRSWEVWQQVENGIAIPEDIRGLLEKTYVEREDEPDPWLKLRGTVEGEKYAHRMRADMSKKVWQPLVDDIEGSKNTTRLNDQETVSLILIERISGKDIELLNGDRITNDPEKYDVSVARALHKNLVKAPLWLFAKPPVDESLRRYIFGKQAVAVVRSDEKVAVDGLKGDIVLYYSHEYGLRIISGVNNESGL